MKTKLFPLFVALFATMSVFAYGFQYGNLCYNITSDSTVGVAYSYTYETLTSAIIPESVAYNGKTYSVTSIGGSAFSGCSGLTSITIGSSVTSIGSFAFSSCSGLTSITIGSSVTSIGSFAFSGCSGLTSITIPNSVTSIGDGAFLGCSGLTSITIPNSVTSIGGSAFSYCSGLTSITIPNSVTSIGGSAFSYCSGLTSITIGNGVTSIGGNVFFGCSSLTAIIWNAKEYPDLEPCNTSSIFESVSSQITSFVFGDSVQHIPAYLCAGMNNLTSVTVGNSVTRIGGRAFYGCSGLTSITIPNSVTRIGYGAFYGCNSLTSITIGNGVTSIGGNVFFGCSSLTAIIWNAKEYPDLEPCNTSSIFESVSSQITSFVFGDSVQHIPAYLCAGMNNLTSVTVGNSVTSIGEYAFKETPWYENLSDGVIYIGRVLYTYKGDMIQRTNIIVKEGTATIGLHAFSGCSGLTSITIPNSVTNIGDYAFFGCSGLTSITIPNSVTYMGKGAFRNCDNLSSVVWNVKKCIGWNEYSSSPFFVENGSKITSFAFGNEVETIPSYLCSNMVSLTSVSIPNNVDSIGVAAFKDSRALMSIVLGDVAYIGYQAFEGTYWLNHQKDGLVYINTTLYGYKGNSPQTAIVREGTTKIGANAFYDCRSLTYISIPSSLAFIEQGAFTGCENLKHIMWKAKSCHFNGCLGNSPFYDARENITSFKFGDEVDSIPAWLCYGMSHLGSITIPASVSSIGDFAFENCTGLTKTEYMGDVAGWYRINFGIYANPIEYSRNLFLNNVPITNLVVPTDMEYINSAFRYDTCLISIDIPEGVTTIGYAAFSGCSNLNSITFPSSITSILDGAFRGCSALKSIEIPNSVTTIGEDAFNGCAGLTSMNIPGNVTSIGYGTFENCISLKYITIPNSVTSIGAYAFDSCISLTSMTIPNNVTSIDDGTFRDCIGLKSITIPNSVTSIGERAFSGVYPCDITCYAVEPPSVNADAFDFYTSRTPLYVPLESMPKYNSSEVWKDFLVLPISAKPVDVEEPVFTPAENKVTITWPAVENAIAYTIEISHDSALYCSFVFDAGGALKNMRYAAPARYVAQCTTLAETMGEGFSFVVEGLDYATTYTYAIIVKGEDMELATYTGTFTTIDPTPAIDPEDLRTTQSQPEMHKVFRNGQVYIIRGGKTYMLTGNVID